MKSFFQKMALAGAVLLAIVLPVAARDGSVIIANKSVPLDSISAAALKNIYTGRTTYWPDGQSVVIAVLDDETADARTRL
jgi:ABC-type phosphate transport system substrate-binding protein